MIIRIKKFFLDIIKLRRVIFTLAKRDFQKQYMGSYLGFVWVFLQPLLFVLVLYSVFTLGLRSGGGSTEIPFSVYLISGIVPWMFFTSIMTSATMVIRQHSFLINKFDFRLSILPVVKLLGGLPVHVFFIAVAIILVWFNGFQPGVFTLQLCYYLFAMMVLLLGISWLTSCTNLFVPDVSKIVSIVVQFGFWLTPIFWNIDMLPVKYQWIVKLNPVFYIVNGYRDSLFLKIPFWNHPYLGAFFWGVTFSVLFVGVTVFGKLRPHFAEVV